MFRNLGGVRFECVACDSTIAVVQRLRLVIVWLRIDEAAVNCFFSLVSPVPRAVLPSLLNWLLRNPPMRTPFISLLVRYQFVVL